MNKEFKEKAGWRHYTQKGSEFWVKNLMDGDKFLGQVRITRKEGTRGPFEVAVGAQSGPGIQNPHTYWDSKSLVKAKADGETFLKESRSIPTEELVSYKSRLPKVQ